MDGLIRHHIHKRKNEGSYPLSPDSNIWMKVLEKATIAAGVIGPIMVIPQIYTIYSSHSAAGVSTVSWFAFAILDIPFLIYGIVHKDKPIVITYALWMIANFIVAIGAVIFA